jgi:hypothetical protein
MFLLSRVDFTPQKLSIELDRPRNNLVSVTFAIAATEFAEASQGVKRRGPADPGIGQAFQSQVRTRLPLEGDGLELLVPRDESPGFPKHPGHRGWL